MSSLKKVLEGKGVREALLGDEELKGRKGLLGRKGLKLDLKPRLLLNRNRLGGLFQKKSGPDILPENKRMGRRIESKKFTTVRKLGEGIGGAILKGVEKGVEFGLDIFMHKTFKNRLAGIVGLEEIPEEDFKAFRKFFDDKRGEVMSRLQGEGIVPVIADMWKQFKGEDEKPFDWESEEALDKGNGVEESKKSCKKKITEGDMDAELQEPGKGYRVVAVSKNQNSFGLFGVVVMARDGEAWQFAVSEIGKPRQGDVIWAQEFGKGLGVRFDINGGNYEIPEKLEDAPMNVVKEVWKE